MGERVQLRETIRVQGLESGADPPEVVADVSAFGGPAAVLLELVEEGIFGLEMSLELGAGTGLKTL